MRISILKRDNLFPRGEGLNMDVFIQVCFEITYQLYDTFILRPLKSSRLERKKK